MGCEKSSTAREDKNANVIGLMRSACWINKATDTLRIFNTYCVSTVTMISQKYVNVAFIHTLILLLNMMSTRHF